MEENSWPITCKKFTFGDNLAKNPEKTWNELK